MIKMSRVACCFLSLAFSSTALCAFEQEVQTVAKTLTERITTAGKKRVAVVDFTDLQGNVTEFGKFLADEISATLADSKTFTVIDTNQLRTLTKEHHLRAIGAIDVRDIQRFGQVVGVDAVVTGKITPLAKHARVSVTALDAVTAAVLGSSRVSIERTADVDSLLARRSTEPNDTSAAAASDSSTTRYRENGQPADAKDGEYRGQVVACGRSNVPFESGKVCVRLSGEEIIQALFDISSQLYLPNTPYPVYSNTVDARRRCPSINS